jgi:molybdate transport system ATP-binding protein
MKLVLKGIRLRLANFVLEVDLTVENRVTGLFGPSGAGKTSLLDLVAGLRQPESALIELDGRVLTDSRKKIEVQTHHRRVGYVPQDLALFPHLSVRRNVLYGYRVEADRSPVFSLEHVADVLEINDLMERRIPDLSGGEKQRVALARALLACPQLLLMDEPLASLDFGLKARILPYLARVRDQFPTPMLYVSHDPSEIGALCDEVLVLERGRVVGRGLPSDVLPKGLPDTLPGPPNRARL